MGFTGANQNKMIYTSFSSYYVQSLYCVRFVGDPKRAGCSFPLPTRVSLYYFTNHLFFHISAFLPGLGDNKDMYNLIQEYKAKPFLTVFSLNFIVELLKLFNQSALPCFSKHCPGTICIRIHLGCLFKLQNLYPFLRTTMSGLYRYWGMGRKQKMGEYALMKRS